MRHALRIAILLSAVSLGACAVNQAAPEATEAPAASLVYPATERQDVSDVQFGQKVDDPYRWLEEDVRESSRVAAWVAQQNALTDSYLATLKSRPYFESRLKALYDYERFGVPERFGQRLFYSRNSGLQNQSVLYVKDNDSAAPRVLIDPNSWAKDGATALAESQPSDDGRYLVYGVQDGGTDWRIVRVLDVATGKPLADEIKWVKFSNLSWAKDGSGFYYSRFPEPKKGEAFQSLNENQAVYFHKIGTPQSADRKIFAQPDRPKLGNTASVSDDGKWLVITSSEGTDARYDITLVDLTRPGAAPRRYITGLKNDWSYLGNRGSTFFWATDQDAPRQRIVTTDVSAPGFAIRELVPQDEATLSGASIVGDTLVASYMVDAKTEVRTYALDGTRKGTVTLPGIGTAGGFDARPGSNEAYYYFTSFNQPTTIYRWDVASGKSEVFAQPKVAFDPADYKVEQVFYRSKDGTRVPMFIVHRKDLDMRKPRPTLLYGYGGFNVSMMPSFSATRQAWMEAGGVFALANIRGGGEYGKAWHDAGKLAYKQNVFDDFIAAGEYLVKEGISSKDKLAIQGGSNGGLLVGAVINQRPDLFAAALPAVGVMDMLRFDRWTAGRYWVDDYGYPNKEADFRVLRTYSPYHNIRSGVRYPAVLVTTADTDDRVVPGHSFKYAAALQAADTGPEPHLIRIETRAGHGSGKPTDKIIDEYADTWAFIAENTGLKTPE